MNLIRLMNLTAAFIITINFIFIIPNKCLSGEANKASDTHKDLKAGINPLRRPPFSGKPSEFYMAVEAVPKWLFYGDLTTQCVNKSFFTWIRQVIVKQDIAQIALLSTIVMPNGVKLDRIPLFMVRVTEQPQPGESPCTSYVQKGYLTSKFRAEKGATFTMDFELAVGSNSDVQVITNIATVTQRIFNIAAMSTAPMFSTILNANLQEQTRYLDTMISRYFNNGISNKATIQMSAFKEDNEDWSDGMEFNIPQLAFKWSGVHISDESVPTTKVRLAYENSLIATNDGRWPNSCDTLLGNKGISGGISLTKLLEQGIGGFKAPFLKDVQLKRAMEQYCREIKNLLSDQLSLTTIDSLAIRTCIIKLYSNYHDDENIRSDLCFDRVDINAIAAINENYAINAAENTVICVPPPKGLVNWWPGEQRVEQGEIIQDIRGGHDGKMQNGGTLGSGKVGQAVTFNGTSDFIDVPGPICVHLSCCL